jgi:outer membrane protein
MKHLVLTCLIAFASSFAFSQQKIGHVNSQELLDTMPSRKAAIVKLRQYETAGQTELEEMQLDFEKAYAKYQKDLPTMSPVIQKIEEEKLMRKQQAMQDRDQSLTRELQAVSQDMNNPILDRLQRAVQKVADSKKLAYVIDESVTLYYAGGTDITKEVLAELLKMDAEESKLLNSK